MATVFSHDLLESRTLEIGRDLAERSSSLTPGVFNRRWWSNTLLEWAMKDEGFKVQLFRFVDVLPSLRTDEQISRVAQEYFGEGRGIPSTLQWGLRAMAATKLGSRLSAASLRRQIHEMAKMFIAGATVDTAAPALAELWKAGRANSVDLLGEATVSEAEADQYRDRCLSALRTLSNAAQRWPGRAELERDHHGMLPRVSLSVKLSALYSQLDGIDPDDSFHAVAARLRPILDLAVSLPASITFDMEQAELKDVTLHIFMRLLSEEAYRRVPYFSIALQAYLKDTESDVDRLLQWARRRGTPIGIRLVKGAYWDSEVIRYRQRGWPVPVFERKADTDASYERITRRLIEHADLVRPAFGTHNLRTAAYAAAAAELAGLPAEACEFQMLFGMAEPLQQAMVQTGRRLRLYTPVGELIPGMAYLVRRLLENTANESFLRKEYAEAEPLEVLLAPPHAGGASVAVTAPAPVTTDEAREFENEPHTDFTKEPGRAAMQEAIARVRASLGGRHVPSLRVGPSGPEAPSRNPSRPDEVVGWWVSCTAADVAAAIATARDARDGWVGTPAGARADILDRAAGLIHARRFDLAALEIFETGKPWREADADVAEAIDFLRFYAGEMRRLGRPQRLGHAPGELNRLMWSPRGIAAVIAPWNFPLAIPTGMVSAALVAGNVVLFKPSERSTLIGLKLVELLYEAGVPRGVLQALPGGPDVGRAAVVDPAVDVVAFTGSKDVGLWIIEEAGRVSKSARGVKHVIAEMGGKNAIIVDETADLDEAVLGVVSSFTGYQGQKCSACARVIVHAAIHDLFVERLRAAVLSLRAGPADQPATRLGPMIDERAQQKVMDYVAVGRQEGRIVLEGKGGGAGYSIGPTIVADIRPEHRLACEEIFGPVLAVMRAVSFDEALAMANESPYALTGGLYSRSPANIARASERFDVGNLYINRPITGALVFRQPFGGHRLSGVGTKAGGEDYLKQFMVARVISENTLRRGFAPSD